MKGFLFSSGDLEGSTPERQRERGQGLLEFALILGVLLLLLMGIIDFGRAFVIYTNLFNAAREGSRFGAVNPWSPQGVESTVSNHISLVDPDDVSIVVCCDTGPGTQTFYCNPDVSVAWACELPSRPLSGGVPITRAQIGDRVIVSATSAVELITPLVSGIVPALPVRTQAVRTIATIGEGLPPWHGGGEGGEGGEGGGGSGTGAGNPGLSLSVAVAPQTLQSGETAVFTYTVQNTGDLTMTVTIADDFGNVINVGVLLPGGTAVRTQSRIIYTTTTNDVTARGYESGLERASASASATVTVVGPSLNLTVELYPGRIHTGETVIFTYTVKNTGDVALTDVIIDDTLDGTTFEPVETLPVGASVSWQLTPYVILRKTTNDVTAVGMHASGAVRDEERITVLVDFDPIIIHEPLREGSSQVVSGTAETGWNVRVRDVMSATFPVATTLVGPSGFEFSGLPLVAGHVIVVEGLGGYDRWSSAIVRAWNTSPIAITPHQDVYLCHGSTVITGTAEPDRIVNLLVTNSGYQDSVRVDVNGYFTFTLPAAQPLQAGGSVEVTGYGEIDARWIASCVEGAYISLSPQCGGSSGTEVGIAVRGWEWGSNNFVDIYWDGSADGTVKADNQGYFAYDLQKTVAAGVHEVKAQYDTVVYTSTFLSPCPAPNLVVSALSLLTTEPISSYQPLDFSVTVANEGNKPVSSMFWVDVHDVAPMFNTPGIGWAAVSALGVDASTTLTITAQAGFPTTGTHQVWAIADSWEYVSELREDDNVYGPIEVNVSEVGEEPTSVLTGTGSIVGETWVSLTGLPVPHGRVIVQCKQEGKLIAFTVSGDDARYEIFGLNPGVYTVSGITWINGVRYSNVYEVEVFEDQATVRFIIMYKG